MTDLFRGTWWVVSGRFLAGPSPVEMSSGATKDNIISLIEVGTRTIVCLQEDHEPGLGAHAMPDYPGLVKQAAFAYGADVSFYRSPVPDATAPPPEQMLEILDIIDRSLEEDRPVYVHCQAGVGRTGTVVGCWLVRHGKNPEDALEEISRLRKGGPYMGILPSPGTGSQVKLVRAWETLDPSIKRRP